MNDEMNQTPMDDQTSTGAQASTDPMDDQMQAEGDPNQLEEVREEATDELAEKGEDVSAEADAQAKNDEAGA